MYIIYGARIEMYQIHCKGFLTLYLNIWPSWLYHRSHSSLRDIFKEIK